MDHFEEQLAHLMRSSAEYTPIDARQRERLHEAVRTRRRLRAARNAAGSVLAVAALALALVLRPGGAQHVEPSSPRPAPTISPTTSAPGRTPTATSEPTTSPPMSTTTDATTSTPTSQPPTSTPDVTDTATQTAPPASSEETEPESESVPPPEISATP